MVAAASLQVVCFAYFGVSGVGISFLHLLALVSLGGSVFAIRCDFFLKTALDNMVASPSARGVCVWTD